LAEGFPLGRRKANREIDDGVLKGSMGENVQFPRLRQPSLRGGWIEICGGQRRPGAIADGSRRSILRLNRLALTMEQLHESRLMGLIEA
jgi:hypothetical protein